MTESHKVVVEKGTRFLSCKFDHDLDLINAVGLHMTVVFEAND